MGSKFPTSPAFNTLSFSSWFRKYRFCTQGLQLSSCTLPDPWLLLLRHSAVSDSLWLHGLQHPRLPCSSPSLSLLKLMSIKSVMPSNHLILCHPLLLLPSIFPNIRVFSNELALRIRWSKYWSSNFSISSSNEYSGLISFRIDWFDLLADQGTLKRLLHHHSSKASVLQCSAFFMVQLSYPHMTAGKVMLTKQCLCFLICSLGLSPFSSKEQASFNFMAAVTIHSDFGAL